MDRYNLIGALSDYAATNSMQFLSGAQHYQNYEASTKEYAEEQLVLTADFDAAVSFGAGMGVSAVTYTGVMMLGRKFEATTVSDLDETFEQKYDRRLYELMSLFTTMLVTFACDNELEITQCAFRMELNKFDTNIDFVAASVTFVQ